MGITRAGAASPGGDVTVNRLGYGAMPHCDRGF